jgi:hypothetical protein
MAKRSGFIFTRRKYFLLLVSVCLLTLGFVLMAGTGNTGTAQFNQDIYSFRRITLSPLILMAGYMLIIFTILSENRGLKKKKE